MITKPSQFLLCRDVSIPTYVQDEVVVQDQLVVLGHIDSSEASNIPVLGIVQEFFIIHHSSKL